MKKMTKHAMFLTAALSAVCLMSSVAAEEAKKPVAAPAAGEAAAAKADVKDTKTVAPAAAKESIFDKLPEVVATIGKVNITKADLLDMLKQQNITPEMFASLPPQMAQRQVEDMVNSLVVNKIMEAVVEKSGITPNADRAKKMFRKQLEKLSAEQRKSMEDELKKQGKGGIDAYVDEVAKNPIAQKQAVLMEIFEKGKIMIAPDSISDADAEKFYRENQEKEFKIPDLRQVSHILIDMAKYDLKTGKQLSEEDFKKKEAAAQKKYAEVKAKLAAGGKFEDLAEQYSDCPSGKAQKGRLPEDFTKEGLVFGGQGNRFDPQFSEGAFTIAKVGEIKEVKSSFGTHFIRLEKITPARYEDFKNVKEDIKVAIAQEKTEENLMKYVEEQKKALNVKIFVSSPKTEEVKK